MKQTTFLLFTLLFLLSGQTNGQPEKFDNILYGVAYYHEYMPMERLDEDIKLMKDAGISVVRVGESTWSLFEPREGEFEFAWMDRIIDKMHAAGIKVILGTPTYSIPAWLWYKHPEVLLERMNGEKAYYGIRTNTNITNPTFLFYSERIIRKMMEHYVDHSGIIGYQVDNETTSRGVNNYDFHVGFVNYLKKKFKTPENLNKIWGLQYWGMTIDSWEELAPRDGITNTGYKLEWERYNRKAVADFLKWQSEIVMEYKRDDQFIMHCFMPAVQDIDQHESAKYMDMMAVNVYHGQQDDLTGNEIAFAGDYFRSIKDKNYLITETNAQTIGWNSRVQQPPYPGQMRQNVYAHLGSGANMVEYWHWHSIHYGQETYWKGVLSHDLQPNRVYKEVTKTAHELERFGKKLVNLEKENKVAILFSHDSNDGINAMPFNNSGSPWSNEGNDFYKNRLIGANVNGYNITYKYTTNDLRLEKEKGGVKTRYFYSGTKLLCEKDDSGKITKVYTNDDEGVLGVTRYIYKDNGSFSHYQPLYYLFDDMGSIVVITNDLGRPVQYYSYDPWGNVVNTENDPINNFTFIGRYGGWKDWDTGFIQFWHRWYDPSVGRWISRDPIGIQGGINEYGYVGNGAINYWDLDGLMYDSYVADIVCDGSGGFRIRYGIQYYILDLSVRICLMRHENVHIIQYKYVYPNACKNKKDGEPTGVNRIDSFECGACSVERKCLQDELNKCDLNPEKTKKIKMQLELVEKRIKKHCK